jgi:DNA-binding winged helix-turn-helix (wHTH) protein
MDQIVHRVLQFDRFELDLTRGYLRVGGRDVELPPKPFELLRHLAENAGRLVSKEELYAAVWPNVTVSDDSLVQCVRELRHKLGDGDHRLIKTVSRRGYLLDAALTMPAPQSLADWRAATPSEQSTTEPTRPSVLRHVVQTIHPRRQYALAATAGLLCVALAATYLSTLFTSPERTPASPTEAARLPSRTLPASRLFSDADAERVTGLADKKQLPLPTFIIRQPADRVPESLRRFVGIWVSDTGWIVSHRQFMLIVTAVDDRGAAEGYEVHAPAQPKSPIQSPAHAAPFVAHISGATLHYSSFTGEHEATLTLQNQINFRLTFQKGGIGLVTLDPVWTLVEAERAAAAGTMRR